MQYVDKVVRSAGEEFGPYKFQQATSIQDAVENWGEQGALEMANGQALVKQMTIARDMAKKGASEEEINSAMQAWKPGFTSVRAAEKRFAELLPRVSSVEDMQRIVAIVTERGIHAAVAELEKLLG